MEAAVASAVGRFGRLDALFAVAGGSGRRFGDGPVHELTLAGWQQTLNLNLTSQVLVARAVLRQMLDQEPTAAGGRGALLLMSSVLAFSPVPDLFGTHAYAAAKGAIGALTTTMAAFYAPLGIRVNAVAPALVATPMSARAARIRQPPRSPAASSHWRAGSWIRRRGPGGGVPALRRVAAVTGQILAVDGGWSVVQATSGS